MYVVLQHVMHFVEFDIGIEFLYQGSSFFKWSEWDQQLMGHLSSEKWENFADTNVCEAHDRAHIIFSRCERQKNKKGNVKFLTENLEEIWDI